MTDYQQMPDMPDAFVRAMQTAFGVTILDPREAVQCWLSESWGGTFRAGAAYAFEQAAKQVPTNWLDPLLTGKDGIIIPCDGQTIERLLRGIAARLRLLASAGSNDKEKE